jgi:hypothetical protein
MGHPKLHRSLCCGGGAIAVGLSVCLSVCRYECGYCMTEANPQGNQLHFTVLSEHSLSGQHFVP